MSYEVRDVDPEVRALSRRRFLRYAGMAASVPILGTVLEACGSGSKSAASASGSFAQGKDPFNSHPNYKFTFVNHVTTNPFFTPTQYGIQDACNLLGCSYQWTGSTNSIASEMVSAMNTAVSAHVDGIALAVIDNSAFVTPIDNAMGEGIPVVAYNAAPTANVAANHYLSYVGQDNYSAGVAVGQKILASGVKSGDLVGGMIATPGTANIQPRMDGAISVLKPAGVNVAQVDTQALTTQELAAVESWYLGHPDVKFMFAVDDGSSAAVATTIQKHNLKGKVGGAGWDVSVPVLDGLQAGNLVFSIDQQAYLQGFVPVVQLFLYCISGGLMLPVNTNTGLGIVTQSTVGPYLSTPTRFEGSTTSEKTLSKPSKISV
jgi:simple sugar transport system substrate-binding protein